MICKWCKIEITSFNFHRKICMYPNRYIRTDETRRKMRLSHLGKKLPKEQIEQIRERMMGNKYGVGYKYTGRKLSDKQKEKIRQSKLGQKASEETKRKMSLASKGKPKSEKHREKARLAHIGIKYTKEARKNMSLAHRGKQIGEKCYFWKGGITPINFKIRSSFEYKLWQRNCLERDNFTDQKTGERGGYLVVHHINNFADFPELRFDPNNGITFRKKTHDDFHKKYGRHNNTRKQLEKFLLN